MMDFLLNLIFPPKCIFCGCFLDNKTSLHICEACYKNIPFISHNLPVSGRNRTSENYCDEIICVCEYSGIIKNSIIRYKFFNRSGYYRAFAGLLSSRVKERPNFHEFDMVLSVPLHRSREAARGYNQSYLISKLLSRETGIPEQSHLLIRSKKTRSQSLLDKNDRDFNIKDAFKVTRADKVRDKTVLLVDDILTTGNTLNECCKVLKEAGAKCTSAAVIASGRKY